MDAQAMEAIYNRLNSVAYTPLSADTFGDWTIEAGDILTVSKDGTSYQTPVMHSTLRWTGGSSVYIESTGNKEREPLNAQSKQAYESGYGGYYAGRHQSGLNLAFQDEFGYMRSYIDMTEEHLWLAFENDLSCTRSEFLMTSESLRIAFENEISCTRSEFQMTSESLRISFENDIASARSEFQMTAESLRISFEDDMESARAAIEVNAQQIALKVSKGDVATQLALDCDNVHITGGEGGGGNLVVDGIVTAEAVQAAIASMDYISAKDVVLSTGGGESFKSVKAGFYSVAKTVNGDEITLHFYGANGLSQEVGTVTFSKASGSSKVSGTWAGGTYTVVSDANGQDLPISMSINSVMAYDAVTYSNGLLNVPIKVTAAIGSGSAADTGYTQDFKVVPTAAMQAVNVSGQWDGTSGKFTAVSSSNNAKKVETTIASVLAYDTVTYSNGFLTVPLKVTAAVGSGSASDTGYTQAFKVTAAPAMQAVDVNGNWDSGAFTATSSANSNKKVITTIDNVSASGTVTYSNGLLNVPLQVLAKVNGGSQTNTGYSQSLKVTAAPAMQAVDVSGSWDGTSGKFTAVSSSNSAKKSETTITSVLADGTVTYSNGILTVPIKVMAKIGSGSAAETGYTQNFLVSASAATQGVNVSGSWDGTSGKFTAVSSANSAKKSETTITSVIADGTVTYSNGLLNVPIKVMAKVGSGSAAETGYTQDFKVTPTAAMQAVNVSGQWDGTSGKFTAVSSSNNAKKSETTITSVIADGTVTYGNGILTVPIKVMAKIGSGNAEETGYTQNFNVTASAAMQAVDVSGNWDSGAFTAVSSANSNKKVITTIDNVSASGTVTYSNGLLNVPLQVLAKINGGNQTNTGYTQSLSVTAAPAMQAVDVSGNWDGTSGKFTAVSSSNSAKKSETTITSVLADGTVTYADGLLNVPIKVMAKVGTGSATDTGYTQDFKVSGTAAYTAGQDDLKDAGGAYGPVRTNGPRTLNQYVTTLDVEVPTSSITGLDIDTTNHQIKTSTSKPTQTVTISYGTMIKGYNSSDNTYSCVVPIYANGSSTTIISTSNTFTATEAYNAGRDSMFLYPGGTGSNGPLWPGKYALREGGASGTIHASWTIPNPWLYVVSSGNPIDTLGYDALIQAGCENGGTIVPTPGAIWKTPPVPTLEMSTAGATVTARMMNGTTELGSDSRTVSTSLNFSFAGPFNNTTTMRSEMGWSSGQGTSKGTLTSAKYYAIEASAGGSVQRIYFRTP